MKVIKVEELPAYLAQEKWLQATVQQLQKDLSWQNLELPLSDQYDAEETLKKLAALVEYLEQGQHQSLMNILYRVDISEQQIQQVMQSTLDETFAQVVARMLCYRCLQKVMTKHHFSNPENTDGEGLLNQ
jgi:hypothetical protein